MGPDLALVLGEHSVRRILPRGLELSAARSASPSAQHPPRLKRSEGLTLHRRGLEQGAARVSVWGSLHGSSTITCPRDRAARPSGGWRCSPA